jgi:hypothetical protein
MPPPTIAILGAAAFAVILGFLPLLDFLEPTDVPGSASSRASGVRCGRAGLHRDVVAAADEAGYLGAEVDEVGVSLGFDLVAG